MEVDDFPPLPEGSLFKFPDGYTVLCDDEKNGLRVRIVETPCHCFYVSATDNSEGKAYTARFVDLGFSTKLCEGKRVWFCGEYADDFETKQNPRARKDELVKELYAMRAAVPKKVEPMYTGAKFRQLLIGKRLSDLCSGLYATKQSNVAVVVHGPMADGEPRLLKKYGKKMSDTRVGEGWVMTHEQYEALRREFN